MDQVGIEPTQRAVQELAPAHWLAHLDRFASAVMMGIEPTSTSIDNAPASPDAYTTLTNFKG